LSVEARAPERTGAGERPALLEPFVHPRGIALVGVSSDERSITVRPGNHLRSAGYPGEVFVVKPGSSGTLHGLPVASAIADVADRCDVAMIMVAADRVVGTIEECAAAGITRAVCITSGFDGETGRQRREQILTVLERYPEMRLIGPNSAGLISSAGPAVLSFSSVLLQEDLAPGRVSLVTQSGAMGNGLLLGLLRRGAGIANWVSTGDELSVGAIELCCAMLRDPATDAVGLFLEGIADAAFLPALARAIDEEGKPVIALRAGGAGAAKEAAHGHTGRVVGDDAIARAALEQAGVEMVETAEALLDSLSVLSVLPQARRDGGARVGVITVSGGLGVVAADEIGRSPNLELADLPPALAEEIATASPATSVVANPYDVATLGDPGVFLGALRALVAHGQCDVVLAIVSTLAHDYELYSREDFSDLPPLVFAHLSPEERFTPEQARRLAAGGVASVPSARSAIRAISLWAGLGAHPSAPASPVASAEQLGLIRSQEAIGDALASYAAPAVLVRTAAEAVDARHSFGSPVAVKAEGSVVAHRTELGAAAIDLDSDDAVRSAFAQVQTVCREHSEEVVVQQMARPGVELFVSAVRDPEVGAAVICRPGGLLVELAGNSLILTGPSDDWGALIAPTPVGRLLAGYRGAPAADQEALVALMEILAATIEADGDLIGIECNPVFVHPLAPAGDGGVTAVDILTTRGSAA
jgi:acyl-CoA synthetase (NDP forming)